MQQPDSAIKPVAHLVFSSYIEALATEWWNLMSSAFFTLAAFVVAFYGKGDRWTVATIGGGAVAFVLVATYPAWKNQRQKVLILEQELNEERSSKNAPDVGLVILDKQLYLVNRSKDKDAHNIILRRIDRSAFTLEAEPISFLARDSKVVFSVLYTSELGGSLWDRYPQPLEGFPADSMSVENTIFLEFCDKQGASTYIGEYVVVFHRMVETKINQVGITSIPRRVSQ